MNWRRSSLCRGPFQNPIADDPQCDGRDGLFNLDVFVRGSGLAGLKKAIELRQPGDRDVLIPARFERGFDLRQVFFSRALEGRSRR
jgi:hypothetical protein